MKSNNLGHHIQNVESPTNLGWVCPDHTPKPDPKYFDKPFKWFVGKCCKLGFPTGRTEPPFIEFMWVQVNLVREIDGKMMLVGYLDNDPYFVIDYKDRDGVAFERNEICAVI